MITKKNYQLHEKDTGSTAVQIISLKEKIEKEKTHLKKNKKDIPARRALKKKIAKTKRFYLYLEKNNSETYKKLKLDLDKKDSTN